MVEIKYNNSTIATVEGGQTATLACNDKEMEGDIEIIASQAVNSPLPIEVATEAEMTALLEAPVVGGIYKYTGPTGAYENGALYVVEEEAVKTYSLTITNTGNDSRLDYVYYAVDSEELDYTLKIEAGETKTIEGVKSYVYCMAHTLFIKDSTVLNNCTIEWDDFGTCKIYPTGDNAAASIEADD